MSKFTINVKDYNYIMQAGKHFTNKDDDKLIVQTVNLTLTGDNLKVTALDGYKAIEINVKVEVLEPGDIQVMMLPTKTLPVRCGSVEMELLDTQVIIKTGAKTEIFSTVDDKPFDTDKLWPDTANYHQMNMTWKNFIDALKGIKGAMTIDVLSPVDDVLSASVIIPKGNIPNTKVIVLPYRK